MSVGLQEGNGFDLLVIDGGVEPSDMGSVASMVALFETLGSFFRNGDPSYRLEEVAVVESAVLAPEPRIVVRVPTTARTETGKLLTSVGRCIAVASGERDVRLRPHEMELCLTLASLLGGSGWERLRISTVEDDWESSVLIVPKELREGLTALGAAHLRAVRRTN